MVQTVPLFISAIQGCMDRTRSVGSARCHSENLKYSLISIPLAVLTISFLLSVLLYKTFYINEQG